MGSDKKQIYAGDLFIQEMKRIQEDTFKSMGIMQSNPEFTDLVAKAYLIDANINDLIIASNKKKSLNNKRGLFDLKN
jgi:hypothetical protein